ncbi:hypothetical protein BR93DRAFT_829779 [Coniochaeta sp. PMI_546]|nr:hypothetical protein BR93DRAFT_829779 [Coniochaeta sp. PMI_546]
MAGSDHQTGLVGLPPELVTHICSYLCPHCTGVRPRLPNRQPDLSRLSRTCRRLRDIVQPIVFHRFHDRQSSPGHRLRLLRVLSIRPDLGQNIKSLSISEPDDHDALTEVDQQFINDSIVRLGLPPLPRGWNIDGYGEHRVLLLELILLQTPNLEVLQIPLDYDWTLNIIRHQATRPFLQKLKSLRVEHFYISGDRYEVSMQAVDALLRASPNLENLSLPTVTDCKGSYTLGNLRRLEFAEDCSIAPDVLSDFVASSPRLEVFALHWDALSTAYDITEDRRAVDAWVALEQRADTLRQIRLDIRDDLPLGHGNRSSMRDFGSLQVLKVNGHALAVLRQAWLRENPRARIDSFLSQLLPASITDVTFWRLDGALAPAMTRLAKVAAVGRYPNLRSVVLAPSELSDRGYEDWPNYSAWDTVRDALEEEFARGGVRFTVSGTSGYWSSARFS